MAGEHRALRWYITAMPIHRVFVDPRTDPDVPAGRPSAPTTNDPAALAELHRLCRHNRLYNIVETHVKGDSLFPISTFPAAPLPVYVARPLVDWRDRTRVDQLEALDWAELYPSEAEARAKMTYAQALKYGKRI